MILKTLREDIQAFLTRDPAARSGFEVVILYQGFHALVFYRLAHMFWNIGWCFIGRLISQFGRLFTGIEIHPGASIGQRFVIDHGAGVVIGETSIIGDDVTLYHDVTLGGVAPSIDSVAQVGQKRHPTLKNGTIIGSGAQILGPITIGDNVRIGANAVVTTNIPGGVTAVGIPARVVMPKDRSIQQEFRAYATSEEGQPDPVAETIDTLRRQVTLLLERVGELEDAQQQQTVTPKPNPKAATKAKAKAKEK